MTTWLSRQWIAMTLAATVLVIVPLLLSADELDEALCFHADVQPSHEWEQFLLILQEEASVLAETKEQ
jgi:hypothetical protein